jgi:hypothetical protein
MEGHALVLVYERPEDCLKRLVAEGHPTERAREIASYLAQSIDMEPELPALEQACAERQIRFSAVTLDAYAANLADYQPDKTLVWTLTDGIAYFSGSVMPAFARLGMFRRVGSDDALFALCQDKFRSGAVLQALGIVVPPTALTRNGTFISPRHTIEDAANWFVKPNRLGAKIGIYPDSHCHSIEDALALSRRIYSAYGDDAVVQSYVAGENLRASWLDVDGTGDLEHLGTWLVRSGEDFQTMTESLALYGETGAQARSAGSYREPVLVDLATENAGAAKAVLETTSRLVSGLGLRDVFSLDFRLGPDGRLTLLEFEVCPGLPCFDFRAYVTAMWGMTLPEAMAELAARKLAR